MQTRLDEKFRNSPAGEEAQAILRSCVHCGFCNATCPTYQLRGDELDGPRGRIYLIKSLLEGNPAGAATRLHLDRCLTCRACETTCPSGVRYHRLLDIGRAELARRLPRPGLDAAKRRVLLEVLPRRRLFAVLYALARMVKPLLPAALALQIPAARPSGKRPPAGQPRRMLLLAGCVQPAMAPNINVAAARVFARLGIELLEAPDAGCCGALRHHLDAQEEALNDMRRNIDAWWPHLEQGAEALVITASGCGAQVREYGQLLRHDARYAAKAARVAAAARDIGEVLLKERPQLLRLLAAAPPAAARIAFHAPCSLQHGQNIVGVVEELLAAAGFALTAVPDAHLCCGSAGTYSILQPELGRELRDNKLAALQGAAPEVIATANIGCMAHLQSGTETRVRHWIELMDQRLAAPGAGAFNT